MALDRNGDQPNELLPKQKRAELLRDKLIVQRMDMDARARRIARDREMHRERREREAAAKGTVESRDPAVRWRKDYIKNEYGTIDEAKDEEIRQEKLRQNVMTSPDIEDLQKQLQVAYIRKQLQAQFDEKKLEQIQSSQTIGSELEEVQKMIKTEAETEESLRQKEISKKLEYRKMLQDQIINKYKLKQEEYRESLKERALLDDAMRCVMEEDQMEMFRKRMVRDKVRKDIEDFRNARALWTMREKESEEREDRKIKDYNKMKTKLQEDMKEKERLKREELQRKRTIVSNIMRQRQDTRDEREQAILLKYEEEQERKAKEKEESDYARELRMKKELRDTFAKQVEHKQERIRIEKQEEKDYINQKLAEYREDKKCEEMSAEKRRRLKMAHKSCVLREIEEKRYRRRLEEENEAELRWQEEQAYRERKKTINEVRSRILKEHTGQLIGYLPPGFLKPSDLPHLPENVRDFYSKKSQKATPQTAQT